MAYGGYKKFFDLLNGPEKFDVGAVFGVFDGDEDVEFFIQMFPVWPPSILFLLNKFVRTVDSDR